MPLRTIHSRALFWPVLRCVDPASKPKRSVLSAINDRPRLLNSIKYKSHHTLAEENDDERLSTVNSATWHTFKDGVDLAYPDVRICRRASLLRDLGKTLRTRSYPTLEWALEFRNVHLVQTASSDQAEMAFRCLLKQVPFREHHTMPVLHFQFFSFYTYHWWIKMQFDPA